MFLQPRKGPSTITPAIVEWMALDIYRVSVATGGPAGRQEHPLASLLTFWTADAVCTIRFLEPSRAAARPSDSTCPGGYTVFQRPSS